MIEKVITGLLAVICLVWGAWLFVRIVRDQGDQQKDTRGTMPPRRIASLLFLVALSLVPVLLVVYVFEKNGQEILWHPESCRPEMKGTITDEMKAHLGVWRVEIGPPTNQPREVIVIRKVETPSNTPSPIAAKRGSG